MPNERSSKAERRKAATIGRSYDEIKEAARVCESSVERDRAALQMVAERLPVTFEAATEAEIDRALYGSAANRNWSCRTLRISKTSLRVFYRWMVSTGRMGIDPLPPIKNMGGRKSGCPEAMLDFDTGDPRQMFEFRGRTYSAWAALAILRVVTAPGLMERLLPQSKGERIRNRNAVAKMRMI